MEGEMFPSFCGAMGFLGWRVMLLVWAGLIALVVWGIARLFPNGPSPAADGSGAQHGGRRADPEPGDSALPRPREREDVSPPLIDSALNRADRKLEVVMHGTHMRYLLIAAGALVVGLLAAGTSVQSLLPFLVLLACPLMMVFMMRGHGGGHGGHGGGHGRDAARGRDDITAGR